MRTLLTVTCVFLFAAGITAARGESAWETIFQEDFSFDPSTNWSYDGRLNVNSQPLIHWNGANGNLDAEWDQSNHYKDWEGAAGIDPYQIEPSSYSRPLGRTLTDADTFEFGATLRISSVVNTTEFYQVANFGLYSLAEMGDDRTMSDNWSGNTTIVKDGSDFVEFNYFIQNDSFGWNPMTQCTIGAHIEGLTGDYTTGSSGDSQFHDTDMGAGNWLPTDTDLYVEVIYHGLTSRRAYSAIYVDSDKTTLLEVNGVQQYYWAVPLPSDDHFTLTDATFWNYVGTNWGGVKGSGSGTFDDIYVMVEVPEPTTATILLSGLAVVSTVRRRRFGRSGRV
ncbi:MAG: PEP-CTERM sorting domain-containing protein [Planctomycetota bacterium]|nr:PEP-CTERM sorting domain-containing protein [Planctomycetota bacterium]